MLTDNETAEIWSSIESREIKFYEVINRVIDVLDGPCSQEGWEFVEAEITALKDLYIGISAKLGTLCFDFHRSQDVPWAEPIDGCIIV